MTTVVHRLRQRLSENGSGVALIQGACSWTHADLFRRVDRLSAALHGMGLRPGDTVAAWLPNGHEAIESELAVLESGLVWITLTARLLWPEVRGVLASCRPQVLITDADGLARMAAGLGEFPLETLPVLVRTADEAAQPDGASPAAPPVPEFLDFEALLAAHPHPRPPVTVGAEEVARLRYTSGTTGSAKAAILPHRVYHAMLDNLLDVLAPVTAADRALHVAPITHGSGGLLWPILHAGGAHVLAPAGFDAASCLAMLAEHRITTMFTVPTMLARLVQEPDFDRYDLSALRALIYGGAPMPEAQLRQAVARIGRALMQIYGMSEAPWPITCLKPADHGPDSPHLHSVGRATTVCTVQVVDASGVPVPPGTVGEIAIQGRNVMAGYRGDDAGTRQVLRQGWLYSGDLGVLDAGGYLTIVGREKDVIISGGFNVYPAEVETALVSHPGVLEAAVVGLPDPVWGEVVTAFVVPRPGQVLDIAALDRTARHRLSGYKCPRRFEVVADLPKNAVGKVQKRALRGES